jgi:hypothetical protein
MEVMNRHELEGTAEAGDDQEIASVIITILVVLPVLNVTREFTHVVL